MTLAQIIYHCKKGDSKGQRQLVDQYAPMLMTVCRRYAMAHYGAQDILQDGFVRIFNSLDQFDDAKGSFEGWMRRIVINTALGQLRKNKMKFRDDEISDNVIPLVDPEIYSQLGVEELLTIITQLPEQYRIVFNLNCVEGYSHKEIAEMLSIEEGSSRSNLSRAKSILRKKILANKTEMSWVKTG